MSAKYLTKDYEGFRQMMIDAIPEKCPEWTDTSQSDFGIALVELLAMGLDVLSYYQDKSFSERVLKTASLRSSVTELCQLLTYDLAEQVPSKFVATFTKSTSALGDTLTVPRGYKVGTSAANREAQVIFEVSSDLVIAAGVQSSTVEIVQGFTVDNDVHVIDSAESDLSIKLKYADVLSNTLSIIVKYQGTSSSWTKVDNFLASTGDDKHFIVETDAENNTFVVFGNGSSGSKPQSSSVVTASYRVGGGVIGNVGVNTITKFVDAGISGLESITNASDATQKGLDVEGIESAKENAPKHYRTNSRAVTLADYEYLMSKHPLVKKAKAVETFNSANELNIYVLLHTLASVVPIPTLNLLKTHIMKYNTANIVPVVKSMGLVNFNITITGEAYDTYEANAVKVKIINIINSTWGAANFNVGEGLTLGQIYKEVLSVEGIKPNITIASPTSNIAGQPNKVLKLGTVSITITGGAS